MGKYLKRMPPGAKALAVIAGVFVLALLLVFAAGIGGGKDTLKGVRAIQKLEQKKVLKIEKEIDELDRVENEKRAREERGMTYAEIFEEAGAFVIGDSFAEGFLENEVLGASSVIGENGLLLTAEDTIQEQIDSVKGMEPKVVFLSFGSADIADTDGDLLVFREEYKKVLVEVQRNMPKTKIYVNLIAPVREKAYKISSAYKKVNKYNETLKELCKENKVSAIDNISVVTQDMYEKDGITMKKSFYSACAGHLIEMAGL